MVPYLRVFSKYQAGTHATCGQRVQGMADDNTGFSGWWWSPPVRYTIAPMRRSYNDGFMGSGAGGFLQIDDFGGQVSPQILVTRVHFILFLYRPDELLRKYYKTASFQQHSTTPFLFLRARTTSHARAEPTTA